MTPHVLNAIFEDFGKPLILSYKYTLKPGFEVLFRSMTEALAATIFLGDWYRFKDKTDSFVFTVQMIQTVEVVVLIKNVGGQPTTEFIYI